MTSPATTAQRWAQAEAELKANSTNMLQVQVMWNENGRLISETFYTRNPSLARAAFIALPHNEQVMRIDILSPMGQLLAEWARNNG